MDEGREEIGFGAVVRDAADLDQGVSLAAADACTFTKQCEVDGPSRKERE